MSNSIVVQQLKRFSCLIFTLIFIVQNVNLGYSQGILSNPSSASLPLPGTMLSLSQAFRPPVFKGIKVYRDTPFRFDFILHKGDSIETDEQLKTDSKRLIRYFLASLTVPEKDLWVNLSPYEKDRIITEKFGQTEMGRDLLGQDYLLKQITASVIYPEGDTGKKFWAEIYKRAQEKFGSTDIPVDTFNKVWIVPDKAVVYEKAQDKGHKTQDGTAAAYIVESRLKVMLETDYLATQKDASLQTPVTRETAKDGVLGYPVTGDGGQAQDLAKQVLREVVIPVLEKEVNEGQNFSRLRQVYSSLILGAWFKRKIKESILNKVYVDRNKVGGLEKEKSSALGQDAPEQIWARYVEAFKKGAYNYIKEEKDPVTEQVIPRKYFSGGLIFDMSGLAVEDKDPSPSGDDIEKAMMVKSGVQLERGIVSSLSLLNIAEHFREFPGMIEAWKQAGVHIDELHYDVMDGRFVEGDSMALMNPEELARIRQAHPDIPVSVHLMVEQPSVDFIDRFIKAGASTIGVHGGIGTRKGAFKNEDELIEVLKHVRQRGVQAEIVVSPDVEIREISRALSYADSVMLMSVEPGAPGRPFISEVMKKAQELRASGFSGEIGMDGAITDGNASVAIGLGVSRFVLGRAAFGSHGSIDAQDILQNTESFKRKIEEVQGSMEQVGLKERETLDPSVLSEMSELEFDPQAVFPIVFEFFKTGAPDQTATGLARLREIPGVREASSGDGVVTIKTDTQVIKVHDRELEINERSGLKDRVYIQGKSIGTPDLVVKIYKRDIRDDRKMSGPVYILGVTRTNSHDATTVLIKDGKVLGAIEEERLDRNKHTRAPIPELGIDYLLKAHGIKWDDIAHVVVGWDYNFYVDTPHSHSNHDYLNEELPQRINDNEKTDRQNPAILDGFLKNIAAQHGSQNVPPVTFVPHHKAHAISASSTSPFNDKPTMVVVLDGKGEDVSFSVWTDEDGKVHRIGKSIFPNSLGYLYMTMTKAIGFANNDEGKVMGLAPYGFPENETEMDRVAAIQGLLRSFIEFNESTGELVMRRDLFHFIGTSISTMTFSDTFFAELAKIIPALPQEKGGSKLMPNQEDARPYVNFAYAVQSFCEEVVLKMVKHYFNDHPVASKFDHLVLAGGFALNVTVNGKILTSGLVDADKFHVPAFPSDNGAPIGAALSVAQEEYGSFARQSLDSVSLGRTYSDDEIRQALDHFGLKEGVDYDYIPQEDDLLKRTTGVLLSGQPIGWFQGGSEYGPRALGNRSILFPLTSLAVEIDDFIAADPDGAAILQALMERGVLEKVGATKVRLKRKDNGPVTKPQEIKAGSKLEKIWDVLQLSGNRLVNEIKRREPWRPAASSFAVEAVTSFLEGVRFAPFMTIAVPVRPEKLGEVVAGIHPYPGDVTTRPQTVSREANPLYWKLLNRMGEETGVAGLLNTSFNQQEPIVETPEEALNTLYYSFGIEELVIGHFVVHRASPRLQPDIITASDEGAVFKAQFKEGVWNSVVEGLASNGWGTSLTASAVRVAVNPRDIEGRMRGVFGAKSDDILPILQQAYDEELRSSLSKSIKTGDWGVFLEKLNTLAAKRGQAQQYVSVATKSGEVLRVPIFKEMFYDKVSQSLIPYLCAQILRNNPSGEKQFIVGTTAENYQPVFLNLFRRLRTAAQRESMQFFGSQGETEAAQALKSTGGIDFTSDTMAIETTGDGQDIRFDVDASLTRGMRDLRGVSSFIIDIAPLGSFSQFFGTTESAELVHH